MPVKTRWDNNKKTIWRYAFHKKWTWQEFEAARAEARRIIIDQPHRVDFIFDLSKCKAMPDSFMIRTRQMLRQVKRTSDVYVIVGQAEAYNFYIKTFQTERERLHYADDLAAARLFINRRKDEQAYQTVATIGAS
jgi:hypothetical protein